MAVLLSVSEDFKDLKRILAEFGFDDDGQARPHVSLHPDTRDTVVRLKAATTDLDNFVIADFLPGNPPWDKEWVRGTSCAAYREIKRDAEEHGFELITWREWRARRQERQGDVNAPRKGLPNEPRDVMS